MWSWVDAQRTGADSVIEAIVFWVLAGGAVLAALAVIVPPFGRNPVHGAMALVACFFCLAGLYVLLAAHMMAALQVIVYAGAIMVLFTFVIMLLNLSDAEMGHPKYTVAKGVGVLVICFVFSKMLRVLGDTGAPGFSPIGDSGTYGGVKVVGNILLRDFLLPFELVSILLLVAIIGALILAKKRV
jgi:NADH-quinone oxidoreductase subunit J